MQTRRDFLKLAAMFSGAASLSGVVPDSIQRAYAITPDPGTSWADADHVVILMQENRSFDHALGTLRGVRGFNDPRALRMANGNSVFVQTNAAGDSYAPWRLDIRDTRVTWMGSLPHSRQSQVDAWNEGRHDGWLDAKCSGRKQYAHLPLTMGYYTREDLPFYYALADAFTVCDQNYCSVMTSTSPNRCYLWTGTIRDEKSPSAPVHVRNEVIDDGGLTWKTFPERLQDAGIRWKSYQNELTYSPITGETEHWLSNYGDSSLEYFDAYHVEAHEGARGRFEKRVKELSADVAKLEASAEGKNAAVIEDVRRQVEMIRGKIAHFEKQIADSGEQKYRKLTPKQRALHDAAYTTNVGDADFHSLSTLPYEADGKQRTMKVPKGDVFYQFRKDVDEDKLPAISWLTASANFSDHPSSPWYGAWYVSEVMNILTKNPEVWKKTIFILTYDENDGYFDHGPSYVAADPKRPETGSASEGVDTGLEYIHKNDELRMGAPVKDARSAPIGMGFRVPMVIASPWSRGGWVNSQLCDHTSTLMFLEKFIQKRFGKRVREENISEWRRTVAGDLTSVFRPYDAKASKLEYLKRDAFVIGIEQAQFKGIPTNYTKLSAEQIRAMEMNPRTSSWMPQQEKGTKPSCALPYELYADGEWNADRKSFELRLRAGNKVHGAHSAGTAFNVYLRGLKKGDGFQAATYAVKAGDTIARHYLLNEFVDGKCCVEVHAPNGFYRSFCGASDVHAELAYVSKTGKLTGDAVLHLRNADSKPVEVSVVDNAYGSAEQKKSVAANGVALVRLNLQKSHGWYDFMVKAKGSDAESRFAGRVDTGVPSVTDPAMGGVV